MDLYVLPTTEEVVEDTIKLNNVLANEEATYPENVKRIKDAGNMFADILAQADDYESAAQSAYIIGRIMAATAVELSKVRNSHTDDVIARYGMSLAYAAHLLLAE